LKELSIDELLAMKKTQNIAIVDVRSPKEYKEDHIEGSINIPLLEDDERALVGTLYKTQGKERAVKEGIDITAPKLKFFHEKFTDISSKHDKVVVYCFRGGMRSGALCSYISSTGIEVYKLLGGYKSYRKHVINYLENISDTLKCILLHGNTGAGKTEILIDLKKQGIPVLDLEKYAKNSGSVYGEIYYSDGHQTQKRFESLLFNSLSKNNDKFVFLESESRKIGKVFIPKALSDSMKNGYHIFVESSLEKRVSRLVEDYSKSKTKDDDKLINATLMLKDSLGKKIVEELIDKINIKDYSYVARYLIENYYDNLYKHSNDKYSYEFKVSSDDYKETLTRLIGFYEDVKGDNYEK